MKWSSFLAAVALLLLGGPAHAQPSTEEIVAAARAYAELSWEMGAANGHGCSAPWRPDFSPGRVVGMAYKWGGFDDIDQFRARLIAGAGAGAHERDGVLACATGIDCSGFVSRVWGLNSKRGTATLAEVTRPIPLAELQPGDALNKPGSHVVLFAGRDEDGAALIYEASGSAGKVRYRRASWGQLNGFTPVRLRAPEATACEGSLEQPIEIATLPFEDRRSTIGACSHRFDVYDCRPGIDEGGPEVIYRLQLTEPTRLSMVVTDGASTDIDVHLISLDEGMRCVGAGDVGVEREVEPGHYLVVADSWVGRNNVARSGEYRLVVRAQ